MTALARKPPETLIVASHNPGKVREIGALLAPLGIRAVSAGAWGLPEPEETEATFSGNACLKARAAAAASGLSALADDSGLEVAGLGGAPGVLSARWAGPSKDFRAAMERVWGELSVRGGGDMSARFVCALALAEPGGRVDVFVGDVAGRVIWPPRGDKGFGYDAIFVPQGHELTFGEMPPEEKHRISHRAAAFAKLLAHWS
jgi:XTP/dITP diphosphohydrolase